jgi:hypothetical protein
MTFGLGQAALVEQDQVELDCGGEIVRVERNDAAISASAAGALPCRLQIS